MKTEQVIFTCHDDAVGPFGGILVDDEYIICGCCGSVFEVDDENVSIIKRLKWISISDEIIGD